MVDMGRKKSVRLNMFCSYNSNIYDREEHLKLTLVDKIQAKPKWKYLH